MTDYSFCVICGITGLDNINNCPKDCYTKKNYRYMEELLAQFDQGGKNDTLICNKCGAATPYYADNICTLAGCPSKSYAGPCGPSIKACKTCHSEPWESCNNNGPCSRYKKEDPYEPVKEFLRETSAGVAASLKGSDSMIHPSLTVNHYSDKSPEFQLAKTIIENHGFKLIKNEDLNELKLALDAALKRLNTIS